MGPPEVLPDDCDVARLVWDPADIAEDGSLLTSAFPGDDLLGIIDKATGHPRFLSVNRTDILRPIHLVHLLKGQTGTQNPEGRTREIAYLALACCGSLRAISDVQGGNPFLVLPEPLPENPAHCGVKNKSARRGRAYKDELRSYLRCVFSQVLPHSDFFGV